MKLFFQQICLVFVGFLLNLHRNGAIKAKMITCACSTSDCQLSPNASTCITSSMCFTQLLDRRDGAAALISRGCIDNRTPLLCENKPPAGAGHKWPVLFCCNSSMCNQHAIPTLPPWYQHQATPNNNTLIDNATERGFLRQMVTKQYSLEGVTVSKEMSSGQATQSDISVTPNHSRNRIISPIYMTVLAVGVTVLVFLGVIAGCLLKRQRRTYTRHHWVTIDGGYLRGQAYLPPPSADFIKGEKSPLDDSQPTLTAALGRSKAAATPSLYSASMLVPTPPFTIGPAPVTHLTNNYVP